MATNCFRPIFLIPIIYLTRVIFTDFISAGPINQISYYRNFIDYVSGKKGVDSYNNYFDGNVNRIMALSNFMTSADVKGQVVYIWGDFPWLYAMSDLRNPSRYVTSFHVFGVPNGKEEVMENLIKNPPVYILKPPSAIGYFEELENFLGANYTLLARVEDVEIWQK